VLESPLFQGAPRAELVGGEAERRECKACFSQIQQVVARFLSNVGVPGDPGGRGAAGGEGHQIRRLGRGDHADAIDDEDFTEFCSHVEPTGRQVTLGRNKNFRSCGDLHPPRV